VDALKRLEYRGYDSAGVATIEHGALARRRAEGKLVNLENRLKNEPLDGTIGIGHTRWATHGVPNETNAHPHFSGDVAVVHNGIIENFAELRDELAADGYEFTSQTDTEVVAHLVARELKRGAAPVEAAHAAVKRLQGAFALAIMFRNDEDLVVGARNGPPLAVGHGDGEMFLGSDAIALAPFTNSITYLEDGDWAVVRHGGVSIFDIDGQPVERRRQQSMGAAYLVDKGNHRHFMEKEIHEQPEVISHTLAHYLDFANGTARDLDLRHGLSCRSRRQVLVRALCAAAGGYRYRLGVPLPRNAAVGARCGALHFPVGRNRRYAGLAALLPQGRHEHRRRRQCA
jgi:glucosamine--fructose-6-phosphate aminotransferase (isomerizing)